MKSVLLLGIGNTLRCDDGAGAAIAAHFQNHPWIESLQVMQLLPEHVERFSGRQVIMFVDAAVNCDQVTIRQLVPLEKRQRISAGHIQNPHDLIALYHWIYGCWPFSVVVSVPAVDLGFGEQFSSACHKAIDEAVRMIESQLPTLVRGVECTNSH